MSSRTEVNHQLKNHLTNIKAYSQLVSRAAKKNGDKEIAKFCLVIDCEVGKLAKLIDKTFK